jgi:dCTP deaminase
MTDVEVREAIEAGDIGLEPMAEESLQPASYDLRLGDKALVTRSQDIEKLRKRIEDKQASETSVVKDGTVSIPAGAFALVVTREKVRLSTSYAGHLGLRSYYARKGLLLLAGLQVDPGFEGYLVLGLANLSPRAVQIDYEDEIATLEFHRLSRPASEKYGGMYAGQQQDPSIPKPDADYLRTIETLSVSELTQALLRLSDNVATLSRDVRLFGVPLGLALVAALLIRLF